MFRRVLIVLALTAHAHAADPLVLPTSLPALSADQIKQAEAAAEGFRREFPNAFPGGANLGTVKPASVTPATAWTRPGAEKGTTLTLKFGSDGDVSFTLIRPNETVTWEAYFARRGETLFGVITHADKTGNANDALKLAGTPFAATVRTVNGKLMVGRIRCEAVGAGYDLSELFSGGYVPMSAAGVAGR